MKFLTEWSIGWKYQSYPSKKNKIMEKKTETEALMETIEREELKSNKPKIDWEQRRYEIAKDVLAACLAKYGMNFDESADVGMCKRCVEITNTLIRKLKGGVE